MVERFALRLAALIVLAGSPRDSRGEPQPAPARWITTVGGGSIAAPSTGQPPIDRFAGITTSGFS